VQPEAKGQRDGREHPCGLAHEGGGQQRPGPCAIAAQQHTGVDEPEQEEYALNRIFPDMLEVSWRIMRSMRRFAEEVERGAVRAAETGRWA